MTSHFNVNRVMLMGRLGADPELRYTTTGQPKCSMSVATSYRYLDKQKNDWTEKTTWHKVVTWGKQGERCKEYLARGRRVFVEGRLENRSYTDKEGQQRHVHEVISDNVVFLEARKDAAPQISPGPATLDAGTEQEQEQNLPF